MSVTSQAGDRPGLTSPLDAPYLARSAAVRRPAYDRTALKPAVVHIGLGAFHRSHQAVYFDRSCPYREPEWGIVGTSLHRRDAVGGLARQRGLYTLTERDGTVDRVRVVGAPTWARCSARMIPRPSSGD